MIKARDLVISPCVLKDVREFIEKNHYSHNINGVKVTLCFSIKYDDKLLGAILYGQLSTTAWKKFSDSENKVLELRRLVILDDAGRNSESRSISKSIKWIKENLPEIEVIVSYADPMYGHSGIIYKASNFKYLGLSGKDIGYKDDETGKVYHSRALRTKYRGNYKPFVVKLRKKLEEGKLTKILLPGKHCFVFNLK